MKQTRSPLRWKKSPMESSFPFSPIRLPRFWIILPFRLVLLGTKNLYWETSARLSQISLSAKAAGVSQLLSWSCPTAVLLLI